MNPNREQIQQARKTSLENKNFEGVLHAIKDQARLERILERVASTDFDQTVDADLKLLEEVFADANKIDPKSKEINPLMNIIRKYNPSSAMSTQDLSFLEMTRDAQNVLYRKATNLMNSLELKLHIPSVSETLKNKEEAHGESAAA